MFKIIRWLIFGVLAIFIGFKLYQTYHDVKRVMIYQPMVKEVLEEMGNPVEEDMVLAMIYTETKGKSADLMQSSESVSGSANTITDSRESIRQGVETLAKNAEKAEKAGLDDWTAVQAYNFGGSYIDYVAENGKENLIKVAKAYSRDVVAPSLGNKTGKTYIYYHPIALIHGGQLYVNGGNIYYSRQVRTNMYIIEFMNLFP